MKFKFVYFIRPVGMDGPIKIGCAMDLDRRFNELEASSPYPLEVAAVVDGGIGLERKLHEYFRAIRSHREWFYPASDLLALVEEIRRGAKIEDVIPLDRIKIPRVGGPRMKPALQDAAE